MIISGITSTTISTTISTPTPPPLMTMKKTKKE